jgi:hypothetical protein
MKIRQLLPKFVGRTDMRKYVIRNGTKVTQNSVLGMEGKEAEILVPCKRA